MTFYSLVSCAIARSVRQPRTPTTIMRHCARSHVRGRCGERPDDPGRRARGAVSPPAEGLRDRPVGQRRSCLEEVCRLRDGRGRGTGPRLHDLRHTMAVRTLIDWYRSGLDPDREMYKLSTWLGHSSPSETYWYLEAVPELLHLASQRAERAIARGAS